MNKPYQTYCILITTVLHVLGLTLFCNPLSAQIQWDNPSFSLDSEKGLPDNYIKKICEDQHGFFWIATNNGISRFDGVNVQAIQADSLPEAYFSDIYLDNEREELWISSLIGLFKMDLQTEKVLHIKGGAKGEKKLTHNYVNGLSMDRNGRLWIATRSGFNSLDVETGELINYYLDPRVDHVGINFINSIFQDPYRDHIMWLAGTLGLFTYDLRTDEVKEHRLDPKKFDSRRGISNLYWDPVSKYLYASVGIDAGQESQTQYLIIDVQAEQYVGGISIKPDWKSAKAYKKSEHELYLSAHEGVAVYNTRKQKITEVLFNDKERSKSYKIIYVDSHDRIWTSSQKGLEVFDPSMSQCQHYYYKTALPKSYHIMSELAISPQTSKVYLAVFGGDGFYEFDLDKKAWEIYKITGQADKIFDGVGVMVKPDGDPIITTSGGLYGLNKRRKQLFPLDLPMKQRELGRAFHSLIDQQENYWIYYNEGLVRYNPKENKHELHHKFPTFCNKTNSGPSLFNDSRGNIWVMGHCPGFVVVEPETGDTRTHEDFPVLSELLEEREISSVTEKNDTLYLLDDYLKLIKVHVDEVDPGNFQIVDLVKVIEKSDFPTPKEIFGMDAISHAAAFDQGGDYFIITTFGLVKFNTQTYDVQIFGEKEGFIFNDREMEVFLANYLTPHPDGRMVYGTRKGIHIFDPRQLKRNSSKVIPYIRNIDINDVSLPTDSAFFHKKHYTLDAGQYYLSFDFSAIDPANSSNLQYKHKLEGVDKEWRVLKDRNSISYPNLKGGEYTFKLMVSNEPGIWNEDVASVNIHIKKFWYDTYLARAFGITFIVCMIILWYHYRLKRALEKEQMRTNYERKLAEVKMNALTAQMNPHFIFNSLNSIDYFIIKNDAVMASEYLNRFSRLIRLILNNSRSNYISLKEDLAALKLYIEIESLRFDNKFEYEVKVSKNLDPELIQVPPMLFQPYVENAIWHGLMQKDGPGRITVTLELDEREEIIIGRIKDNGIGRKKALELKSKGVNKKKNKSMGMQITHDKIEAINFLHDLNASVAIHDLHNDQGKASGTEVVLEIPI